MPAEAQAVRQLFDEVAPHYDRLNDLLSLGLHRLWKREMVQRLAPVAGEQWLDLCCGTGDLALVLAERLRLCLDLFICGRSLQRWFNLCRRSI